MYYIGVDIGGTFTDCVMVDDSGRHYSSKALSTKHDPVEGVLAGLELLAEDVNLNVTELLTQTARFSHGTTIGTNAVLERLGARVGLVTTAGHGDALAIMRGSGRVAGLSIEQVYSVHGSRLPEPITVRNAVIEIDERIDSNGEIVVALDIDAALDKILRAIDEFKLDSIAIAFLWSFVNPAHEQALADAVRAAAPNVFLSISSAVSPRLGEYERMVATVMNGYVGPACSRYLGRLETRLRELGLSESLLVMQSNGGVLPAPAAAATSLGTIDSGPAGGLTGVATLARRHGHDRVVATDMGGTSFDIGLVIDGKPTMSDENVIDQYTYRLPHLAVRTIACGGGTLARFDEATAALRVGPQSAGSEPGPACYGRGATEPTVTDADVVLGFLRPEAFLDGRMPLDRDASVSVMSDLAHKLGMSVEDTAAGILEINNVRAATVIRQQTLERGHDPRDFVMYAYGGAGPVHAFGFAAESGVKEVVIPLGNGASTLSAFGIASGDVVHYQEVEKALAAPFDAGPTADRLASLISDIDAQARKAIAEVGVSGDTVVEIDALMRFHEQLMHSLEIPISLPSGPDTGTRLLDAFNAEYAHRYGSGGTALFQDVEIFAFRARASIPAGITVADPPANDTPAVTTTSVYWPGTGWTDTTVHTGIPSSTISGPALVELAHTTIAVPGGATLSYGPDRELRLHLSSSQELA
ncbi:hydantoinase/oxoprolinase family protein [Rhodococcus opacus]|uniref:hydantoinase/oxoprolinase family protein n=1 Tax=Rhodococcus opacus TaxID=37919 RepID=UPI001F58B4BD|nr:hydantoinase/oxoprolinase family protein [Rhodococcus opacus]UNN05317.1 hydantoinase/oxoprolinase family protein [Rhodococcus opacus]